MIEIEKNPTLFNCLMVLAFLVPIVGPLVFSLLFYTHNQQRRDKGAEWVVKTIFKHLRVILIALFILLIYKEITR